VNAALASVRAITSVYDGIERTWGPVLAEAQASCLIGDIEACIIAAEMEGRGPSIFARIAQVQPQAVAADTALGMLGESIVSLTPQWASTVAQQVAVANKARGAFTDPMPGDRLPFELQGEQEMAGRVRRQAMRDYGPGEAQGWVPVATTDPVIFEQRAAYREQYRNAIRGAAQTNAGKRWVPKYKNARERREMLAITVFADRANEDRIRLGKMDAAGGQNTADVFPQRDEVAVARAEPYFTLNGGEPDGRPGWSGRLRPVILANDDSAQSLAKAAGRGGANPGVSAWRAAFQAVAAANVKVPH
jgi:hypothetical protein